MNNQNQPTNNEQPQPVELQDQDIDHDDQELDPDELQQISGGVVVHETRIMKEGGLLIE
jgi:hypothetical protein